jgi:hypothetical protein
MGDGVYSESVLKVLREFNSLEEDDTSKDDEFNSLTSNEVFEQYCKWNGLMGSLHLRLKAWVKDIYDVDLDVASFVNSVGVMEAKLKATKDE